MTKFESRINRLIMKTHNFISNEDYCLLRDYFQSRFDEEEKPPDLDEKVKLVDELYDQYRQSKDPQIEAKMREIVESCIAIELQRVIPWTIENCSRYPRGIWLPKSYTNGVPKLVRDAKEYFAHLKSKTEKE
jgi:hypothetical protein